MFIIDLTNPLTLILLLTATVLLTFLGKEIKKPFAPAAALIFFLVLILMHSVQLSLPQANIEEIRSALVGSLGIDFIMIFISFFGYLWVDDIACKFYKKKTIDNSLDWFWNKV